MQHPSVLILCSGGLKSTFLTTLATKEVRDVKLLFVNHEQVNYDRERSAVMNIAQHFNIPWDELVLIEALPKGWPPLKLTAFLWAALMYARHHEYYEVYFGPSEDDYRPEATLKYISELKNLLDTVQPEFTKTGQLADKVKLQAPCIKLTEERILRYGQTLKVPWNIAWSCDKANRHHCGTCPSCVRRQLAFDRAKLTDPTFYITPYVELRRRKCIIKNLRPPR